jgi:hypothetical protein
MKEVKATSIEKSKKSTKEELPRCQKVRCCTGWLRGRARESRLGARLPRFGLWTSTWLRQSCKHLPPPDLSYPLASLFRYIIRQAHTRFK